MNAGRQKQSRNRMNLRQSILNSFNTYALQPAFCINNEYFTFSNLESRSFYYFNKIRETEKPVGIYCADHINTYAAILACMLSGKAYVPIHPSYPLNRIKNIKEQAGIEFLCITTHEIPQELRDTGFHFIYSLPENVETSGFNFNNIHHFPDLIAYILFTSGSTGVPKGVPITHGNIEAFVNSFDESGYEINDNDRVLQMFELTFDLSVMSYLLPLLKGACVFTVPSDEIKYMAVYKLLEEKNITVALMVPSIISSLKSYFEDIHLPQLKLNLFCGEALYADTVKAWKNCVPNARIENVYGPTEATIFISNYRITEDIAAYNGICSIGKAMPGNECIIVDENNQLAGVNEKGQLALGGPQLTPGYLNDRSQSSEAFFEMNGKRFYKTGDLAYYDESGNIFYCGRLDHQVKVRGGFRVELNEIEKNARDFTQKAVAAVSKELQQGFNYIYLFAEKYGKDEKSLEAHLKNNLPDYMLPERIIIVDELPLNNSGKTDRVFLKSLIDF